jgi:hypothetical protein
MIQKHEEFIRAIHGKKKVRLDFFSQQDNSYVTRICAPMDYGPSRRSGVDSKNRYHLWDYESADGPHPLSLKADQIRDIQITNEMFEPDFVSWTPNWFVSRNWGAYS